MFPKTGDAIDTKDFLRFGKRLASPPAGEEVVISGKPYNKLVTNTGCLLST